MSAPNDDFQPGDAGRERPQGTDTQQNDYTSRTGQKDAPIPVQADSDAVESEIDPAQADSDAQLRQLSHNIWCALY